MATVVLLEKLFAGALVFVCIVLLVRQFIGAARRNRLDARLRPAIDGVRRWARRAVRWPAGRRAARREAEAAIRRARADAGVWDGNVYRPKPFDKSRKPH